jgi:hypothetical protein
MATGSKPPVKPSALRIVRDFASRRDFDATHTTGATKMTTMATRGSGAVRGAPPSRHQTTPATLGRVGSSSTSHTRTVELANRECPFVNPKAELDQTFATTEPQSTVVATAVGVDQAILACRSSAPVKVKHNHFHGFKLRKHAFVGPYNRRNCSFSVRGSGSAARTCVCVCVCVCVSVCLSVFVCAEGAMVNPARSGACQIC